MGGRDHAYQCEKCGAFYGGLNDPDTIDCPDCKRCPTCGTFNPDNCNCETLYGLHSHNAPLSTYQAKKGHCPDLFHHSQPTNIARKFTEAEKEILSDPQRREKIEQEKNAMLVAIRLAEAEKERDTAIRERDAERQANLELAQRGANAAERFRQLEAQLREARARSQSREW